MCFCIILHNNNLLKMVSNAMKKLKYFKFEEREKLLLHNSFAHKFFELCSVQGFAKHDEKIQHP